jgi:hypothetical protein
VLKLKYHKRNLLLGSANNGVRWQGKNKGDIPVIALLQLHYAEMKLNFFFTCVPGLWPKTFHNKGEEIC